MATKNIYFYRFFPLSACLFLCSAVRLFLWLSVYFCLCISLLRMPLLRICLSSYLSGYSVPLYLNNQLFTPAHTSVYVSMYQSVYLPGCASICQGTHSQSYRNFLPHTHQPSQLPPRPPGVKRAKEPTIVMPFVVESYLWHHKVRLFTPTQSRRPLQLSPAHCNSISIFLLPWIPRTLI